MNKLFSIFFVSLILAGCKGEAVEEIVERFPDGSEKLVRYYIEDGQVRELTKEIKYYPNHKKYYEGEFRDNHKDGKWTVWYENGNVWSEGFFKKGMDDGLRTGYHENGKKHFQGNYREGKMVGKWVFWDEGGKQVQEVDYDKKK